MTDGERSAAQLGAAPDVNPQLTASLALQSLACGSAPVSLGPLGVDQNMLMILGLAYLFVLYIGTAAGVISAALGLIGLLVRACRVPAVISLAAGLIGVLVVLSVARGLFFLLSSSPPRAGDMIWVLWAFCGFAAGALPTAFVSGATKAIIAFVRRRGAS